MFYARTDYQGGSKGALLPDTAILVELWGTEVSNSKTLYPTLF